MSRVTIKTGDTEWRLANRCVLLGVLECITYTNSAFCFLHLASRLPVLRKQNEVSNRSTMMTQVVMLGTALSHIVLTWGTCKVTRNLAPQSPHHPRHDIHVNRPNPYDDKPRSKPSSPRRALDVPRRAFSFVRRTDNPRLHARGDKCHQ